jgi:signal transduction histidine kinase
MLRIQTNSHRHLFEATTYKQSRNEHMNSPLEADNGIRCPVLVTIDIQPSCNYEMPLDKGAWKRIIMNLLGNALKYTVSGQITVKLDLESLGKNSAPSCL